jgi:hypothetical protein
LGTPPAEKEAIPEGVIKHLEPRNYQPIISAVDECWGRADETSQ